MRNSFEGPSGYTGGAFENELLGEVICGWDAKGWLEARRSGDQAIADNLLNQWTEEHLPTEAVDRWGKSNGEGRKRLIMDWAREHQPTDWNPKDPRYVETEGDKVIKKNIIAGNLHDLVADKLGLEDYNALKFYTTAQTPADTLYGVDGFFEFEGTVFTIDVTIDKNKNSGRADYVLKMTDPGNEQELYHPQLKLSE